MILSPHFFTSVDYKTVTFSVFCLSLVFLLMRMTWKYLRKGNVKAWFEVYRFVFLLIIVFFWSGIFDFRSWKGLEKVLNFLWKICANPSDRCSSNVHCQHPPWSPVSIGKPGPKIHQWTIYFCRWGFGWVDKAQCFRSARRFGAVGSSPDFSGFFTTFGF